MKFIGIPFRAFWNWLHCHIGSSCNCTYWENLKEEFELWKESK